MLELKLRVLTPTHIGLGSVASPLEYTVKDGKVYLYDWERLTEALKNFSKEQLEQRFRSPDLSLFHELKSLAKPTYAVPYRERPTGNIQLFTKSLYRVFIPATAIKGALRTAVGYRMIKENEHLRRELNKLVQQAENNQLRWEDADKVLQRKVFRDDKNDLSYDLFRALLLSDTDLKRPEEVLEVDRVVLRGSSKNILIFAELLKPDTEFTLRLHVRDELLKHPKSPLNRPQKKYLSLAEIKESCRIFYTDVIKRSLARLKDLEEKEAVKFYEELLDKLEKGAFLLRLGRYQGLLSVSWSLLFERPRVPKTVKLVGGLPPGWVEVVYARPH